MKKYQEQPFLEDYLNALKVPTNSIATLLKDELKSVEETFDYRHKKSMEIIEEEETDRQYEEEESQVLRIKKQFNAQIRKIVGLKYGFQQILNVYKVEIKSMAKSIIELEEELNIKKKQNLQQSRKSSKSKSKGAELPKSENEDDLKIRRAPEPVKVEECQKCMKMQQDKTKWKTLSNKIEEFKKKNNVFEIELKHKQSEIKDKQQQIDSLKQKVIQLQKAQNSERQEDQRKKLKKDNTNLRGQKVLMSNQIASLRKQLAERTEISDVQDIQIKKLRLEIDNLNSSLNWHINNLSEVRNSQKRGLNQQQKEQSEKVETLHRINKAMARTLEEQEELLQAVNNKTKKLQQGWLKELDRYERKINEMQSILEDKNETIIKLKTSSKGDKQSSYHSDMIKVLNKKLAEKEELIRNMQDQLECSSS